MARKFPKVFKYIDYRDCNRLLDYVKDNYNVVFRKKDDAEPFKWNAFIEDTRVTLKITLRVGSKSFTTVTRKDTEDVPQRTTGVQAFTILSQYYKVHRLDNAKELGSAIPLLWYNEKYNNTRHEAYAYDLNSAYSDAMTGLMPDTRQKVGEFREVREGELGFLELPNHEDIMLMNKNDMILVEPGNYATIIFKAMESPFKRFVEVWYNRKNNAANKAEKTRAKGILNFAVGYFQLVNPYLRATIVSRCNKRVRSLMDENTLYCNTDSLVSLTPRPDLTIGKGLGEWKLEHHGMFAYKCFNYQWDDTIPTYRGISKAWFKKGWDLLVDEIPQSGNIFELDKETLQLRRIDYGEE